MTTTPNQSSPRYSKSRRHRALAELAVGLVPLALVTTGITRWFGLPNSYVLLAFLSYLVMAGLVISWLPSQDWPGLGAGNRVTAGRGTLVASLAALIPYPQILFDEGYW